MDRPESSREPRNAGGGDDLDAFSAFLGSRARVLIATHVRPDGDAVGSSIALARGLQAVGKEARVLLADMPAVYSFLDPDEEVFVPGDRPDAEFYAGFDVGVLLDASDPSRAGPFEAGFLAAPFPRICLDHHLTERRSEFAVHMVDVTAAATGSLVLRVLDLLSAPIDSTSATALFVAIATDTGWFRYANTTAVVFEEAARLLRTGIDAEGIFRRVYEKISLARLKLEGEVIDRVEADFGGAFIWSHLDSEAIAASGVPLPEFEGLIDSLRAVDGAEVAALLTEVESREWKVSLRSRNEVNVQEVAVRLGGGGHAKAAGGHLTGDFEAVKATLRREVGRAIGQPNSPS